jgi:hypothetical protein
MVHVAQSVKRNPGQRVAVVAVAGVDAGVAANDVLCSELLLDLGGGVVGGGLYFADDVLTENDSQTALVQHWGQINSRLHGFIDDEFPLSELHPQLHTVVAECFRLLQ